MHFIITWIKLYAGWVNSNWEVDRAKFFVIYRIGLIKSITNSERPKSMKSIQLLFKVLVRPTKLLIQSGPCSLTERVNLEFSQLWLTSAE
jgi:hypothetical protein